MLDSLYYNSLLIAWAVLLILSFVLFAGKVPQTQRFRAYNKTRKLLAVSLFFWSVQILLQWIFNFREEAPHIASALNITCYYLGAILFGMGYTSLLNPHYISSAQTRSDFTKWGAVCVTVWSAVLFLQDTARLAVLIAAALFFLVDSTRIALLFFRTYHKAVHNIENYYSENVEAFIRWLSHSVLGIVFFGMIGAVMAFAPKWMVGLYMSAGIVMFVYIFISLLNYSLNCEIVEQATEEQELDPSTENATDVATLSSDQLDEKLAEWRAHGGYCQRGVTIGQLAELFGTNCNNLSEYFNRTLHTSFRDWINNMRMSDAKKMLSDDPTLTIDQVAEQTGFSGKSYFCTLFKQYEKMTPTEWRKQNPHP
ncbi:MAG: helix-turn-helix domain-containing protein [Alistipes sp.]|nr:helix-turn-helix domain-containing protein [Alistipes sp.]